MERKIGEVFKFEGRWLKVKEDAKNACRNCYLSAKDCSKYISLVGECLDKKRSDNKDIVFEDVTYKPREQPQEAEQPQKETEIIKGRKIGEVFEFEGKTLKVVETTGNSCDNCYFFQDICRKSKECESCLRRRWTDNKPVIFVEVKEETKEQQQEEQKLNLCEILKDCPNGTKLYSPIFGKVDFEKIRSDDENAIVITKGDVTASFTKEGFYYADLSEECLLFPSKNQRDWSKFTAPWLKKERFDPKTLKPFDKVLVRDSYKEHWLCRFFSHIVDEVHIYKYITIGSTYKYCIPYNDDTKHLVGTTEEAPEFYKYWED